MAKLRVARVAALLRSTEILTPGRDGVRDLISGAVRTLSPDEPQPCHAGTDPDDPWCYQLGFVRPEVAARAGFLVAMAELGRWIHGGDS